MKFIKQIIQKPLIHICILSFHMGIVPEQIKIVKVVPIYKHEDPSQFNNYRPVLVWNVVMSDSSKFMPVTCGNVIASHPQFHYVSVAYKADFVLAIDLTIKPLI